jgi:hypothetical protein
MRSVLLLLVAVSATLLAGCATSSATSSPSPPSPASMPSMPSSSSSSSMPSTPSTSTSSGSTSSSSTSGSPASGTSGKTSGTADSTGNSSSRQDGSADTDTPAAGDARTPEERRAGVDGKLDASLGTFDDQLRREQQRTAQERDARAAGRPEGAAVDEAQHGAKQGGGRDRSGDLHSETAQNGDKAGQKGDEKGDKQAGGASMPNGGGGASAANALPSGVDDDIIARRLRKAAEAETDPELKEKLWKEYRDYKENTRSGG